MSIAFKPYKWTVSAAVSKSQNVIDAGYDVAALSEYLDWIGVMNYNYHGNWESKTGHIAPMYHYPGDAHNANVVSGLINSVLNKNS